jgi:hypothetical protein
MSDIPDHSRHLNRKNLTFRQAEGIHPLPMMLTYGELDARLRRQIWDALYISLQNEVTEDEYSFYGDSRRLALTLTQSVFEIPIDEGLRLADHTDRFYKLLKDAILDGHYADCLEIVQVILRSGISVRVMSDLIAILNGPTSPYQAVDMKPWTIVPRGNESEREAFNQDWPIIASSPFDGSKTHLRYAAEELNAGRYPAAMREAIHAVESAGKVITGQPSADLAAALKVLGKDKGLHSALRDGFIKLYGYTSDEKGVRHALIDATNVNVGRGEALFFFSSCTAFVAYLARTFAEIDEVK